GGLDLRSCGRPGCGREDGPPRSRCCLGPAQPRLLRKAAAAVPRSAPAGVAIGRQPEPERCQVLDQAARALGWTATIFGTIISAIDPYRREPIYESPRHRLRAVCRRNGEPRPPTAPAPPPPPPPPPPPY